MGLWSGLGTKINFVKRLTRVVGIDILILKLGKEVLHYGISRDSYDRIHRPQVDRGHCLVLVDGIFTDACWLCGHSRWRIYHCRNQDRTR